MLHRFLSWQKSSARNKVIHEPSEFRETFDCLLLSTVVQEEPELSRIQRCDLCRLAQVALCGARGNCSGELLGKACDIPTVSIELVLLCWISRPEFDDVAN